MMAAARRAARRAGPWLPSEPMGALMTLQFTIKRTTEMAMAVAKEMPSRPQFLWLYKKVWLLILDE